MKNNELNIADLHGEEVFFSTADALLFAENIITKTLHSSQRPPIAIQNPKM